MLGSSISFLCVLLSACALEKYTDKYDNVDLEEILGSKRLLRAYVNCMLDRGKCTGEGKELKEHLQDALETGCAKCTDAQQKGTAIIINHLIRHEPDMWHELTSHFDPRGEWSNKYEDRAKSMGIILPRERTNATPPPHTMS